MRVWNQSEWLPKDSFGSVERPGSIYYGEGSLVVDRTSKPLVATQLLPTYRDIDLRFWASSGWDPKYESESIQLGKEGIRVEASRPGVALDSQNRLVAAYLQSIGEQHSAGVQRWDDIAKKWETFGPVQLPKGDPLVLVRPAVGVTRIDSLWMIHRVLEGQELRNRLFRHSEFLRSPWAVVSDVPAPAFGKLASEPVLRLTLDGFPVTVVVSSKGGKAVVETFVWPSLYL